MPFCFLASVLLAALVCMDPVVAQTATQVPSQASAQSAISSQSNLNPSSQAVLQTEKEASPQGENKLGANEVVATVNQQKITRAQVDEAAANNLQGISDPDARIRIKTQVLTSLINQALVEQAIAQIDPKANPDWQNRAQKVIQSALNSEYMKSRIGELPDPNEQVISQIYRESPDFYAKRKIYHYLVLTIPLDGKVSQAEVETTLSIGSAGFDALKDLLKSRKVNFGSTNNWLSGDEINPGLLGILKELPESRTRVQLSSDKKGLAVVKSIGVYSDPVSYDDAKPVIIRKINGQKQTQLATNILADLRAKANIDIYEQALAGQYDVFQRISSKGQVATRLERIRVIWSFALPILALGALIAYYRALPARNPNHVPVKKRLSQLLRPKVAYSGKNIKKSFLQIAREEIAAMWRTPFIQYLFIGFLALWFCRPLYSLFDKTPEWVTLEKLIKLSSIGILVGFAVIIACWKLPALHRLFSKRWAGVGTLFAIHLIVLIV